MAASELAASITRAGATAQVAMADPPPRVRTFALTDFVEARLARRAAVLGIAEHDPGAVIYCSITAALLWPRPGAISVDSIAAANRPGRHGIWQRPVERMRLKRAPLVLAWSERALEPLRGAHPDVVFVSAPVETPSAFHDHPRDIAAVTYAGDPEKRRLALVVEAWNRARRPDETMVVVGTDTIASSEGVAVAGRLAPNDFHALLGRARAFVAAPRREDFGISALEALAHGCQLVTTPAPGPYPALDIARKVDTRLVSDDLVKAIRFALDDPVPDYAERAAHLLAPYHRDAVDRVIADQVLPRLLDR